MELVHMTSLTIREYAQKALNTSIATRKVLKVVIEQGSKNHHPRPNMHVLVVSPPGTFKSTLLNEIEEVVNSKEKGCIVCNNFTLPAFQGTITKHQDFVKGLVWDLGGKLFLVDEFNNLKHDAYSGLIEVLENQRVERKLGYNIRGSVTPKKDEYTDMIAHESLITGTVRFSNIAFAMYFPKLRKTMSDALISRYVPVFINPTESDIIKGVKGENKYGIEDRAREIKQVTVKREVWAEFVDWVDSIIDKWPYQKGYMSRAYNEAVRFAVFDMLGETTGNTLTIDDPKLLKRQFKYIIMLLSMYQAPESNQSKFERLVEEYPGKTQLQYAEMLGVSQKQVSKMWGRLRQFGGVNVTDSLR